MGQSDRAHSLRSSEPEANRLSLDQLHSCPTFIKSEPEPIATPSIQDAEMAGMSVSFHIQQQKIIINIFTAGLMHCLHSA